jgi:hypothetical protein
VAHTNLF